MAGRADIIRQSFVSGELDPRLQGRDDLDQYHKGALRLRNFLVLPHGGITRRPGTYYMATAPNSAIRLIPFRYSETNVYVLEFSDNLIRFYTHDGILMSGGSPVALVSPYSAADLPLLQTAQEADVLYIVHPDKPPHKLKRLGPTSFSIGPVQFSLGRSPLGPYNTDKTLYIATNTAGTTYDRRFTFSGAHGLTSADLERTFHVYRYRKSATVKFRAATTTIKQIVSSTVIEVDVNWEYESGDAAEISGADSYTWALGLFSATEGCNAVTFHEGRLIYGGFKRKPDYFVASVSDDFDNFETENVDPEISDSFNADKAFGRRTVSRQVNAIRWLASAGNALAIGTTGGEFLAQGNVDGIMTPADAVVKAAGTRGSEAHTPAIIDSSVFFIQRGGRVLRRFAYDYERNQFGAIDVSVLAAHLFEPGIVDVVYHQTPYSVLWCLRSDGKLIGLTYERDQQVVAAHLHEIGGSPDVNEAPFIETLTVVPGPDGEDVLWLGVRRRLPGGSIVKTVEQMQPLYRPDVDPNESRYELTFHLEEAFFVDCGVTYDQPIEVTTVTNTSPPTITTAVAHGLSVGDLVTFRGIGGWTGYANARVAHGAAEINGPWWQVTQILSATEFRIGEYPSGNAPPADTWSAFDPYAPKGQVRKLVTAFSGLGHFGSSQVAVFADGSYDGLKTVSGGTVTIEEPAAIVHIGFPYKSLVETTPITASAGGRSPDRGAPMGLSRVAFLLYQTNGGRVARGPNPVTTEDLEFREVEDALDRPAPLFTGEKVVSMPGAWDIKPTIIYEITHPAPVTVLGMVIQTRAGTDA